MAAIRLLAEMWNWKVSSLQIHSDHAMFCTAIEFCAKTTTTTTEIEAFEIFHVFCVKKNSSLESKSNEQKVAKKDDFNWFTNTKSQNPRWWFTWNFHWNTKKCFIRRQNKFYEVDSWRKLLYLRRAQKKTASCSRCWGEFPINWRLDGDFLHLIRKEMMKITRQKYILLWNMSWLSLSAILIQFVFWYK